MATRVVSLFLLLGLLGSCSAHAGTMAHRRAASENEDDGNSLDSDKPYEQPELSEEVDAYKYDMTPVRFELYTRQNPTDPVVLQLVENTPLPTFRANRPTKIGIHGWMTDGVGVKGLRDAFLGSMDVNFILVNWTLVDSLIYPAARWKVDALGKWVALMLDYLHVNEGLDFRTVHVVGHSLGAHIAGVAGASVKKGRIPRISGLDPAGVLFNDDVEGRLSPEKADFVDVIHTCANVLGFKAPLGHIDFYPNRGNCVQPGCAIADLTSGTCSHNRAYDFYLESVTGESFFKAWPCDGPGSDANMTLHPVVMGYPARHPPPGAPTVFCLKTNSRKPFGLSDEQQLQGGSWLPNLPNYIPHPHMNSPKRTAESHALGVFVWMQYMTRGLLGNME